MSAVEDVPHVAPPAAVPPPTPEGKRFGLFSVAQIVDDNGLRWEVGIEWEPLAGEPAGILSTVCEDPAGLPLDPRSGESPASALPFAVFGSYDCGTFSRPLDEAENRARQHLALGEERAVEQAIAAGGFDNAPTFAGADDLTPAGGAVPANVGLGLLEAALGRGYGGQGVIHSPRYLSPLLEVAREGQRITTRVGTPVAFGAGYDLADVGPTGNPPPDDNAWMFATSRPIIRRSEVFVTPDADHRPRMANNQVTVVAQRVYLVGWEAVTAAVLVEPTAAIAPSGA